MGRSIHIYIERSAPTRDASYEPKGSSKAEKRAWAQERIAELERLLQEPDGSTDQRDFTIT